MNAIFHPFVDAFIDEINEAFEQLQFWVKLTIFDPRKLPKAKKILKNYGNEELRELLANYAVSKTNIFRENRTFAWADTDFDKAKSEWSGFEDLIFQKHKNYYHLINSKIAAVQYPANECKTAVTNWNKRTRYVLGNVTLGIIL